MEDPSHWIATGTLPRFPRLARNLAVDVVIVGGGITGITAAYLCRQAGLSFALIERDRLARMDTGHTTAHLTPVTDLLFTEMTDSFGNEAARAVWDAGGAAIDRIVANIRSENITCDFRWLPGYLHAPTDGDFSEASKELEAEAEAARSLGVKAEFLPSVPLMDAPGVRFPQQALFHPRKYLAGLVRSFGGKGAHVFEQTAVDTIEDNPLTVKAGDSTITCGHLILATHTPLQGNTGTLSALLFQTKLALYTSYALSAQIPPQGVEALFWDTKDPYDYLRVEHRRGHDLLIFGGEDHKTGQEESPREAGKRLAQRFQQRFPNAVIQRQWSGQVIETADGLPYIGSTAVNQFIATGYAGNGMTFGTLGAMMALDAITGRRNPWIDLFQVNRKKVRGSAWEYLKENKDYPYHLLRDYLAPADAHTLRSLNRSEGKIVAIDGRKVAAYRDASDKITLSSPVCPHLGCIVGWNDAAHTWDCPCHGSRFRATGEVISGPAEKDLEKLPELEAAHANETGQ